MGGSQYYIQSPKGLNRVYSNHPHGGNIGEIECFQAICFCKWAGPPRCYPYEAKADLFAHFRRENTLIDLDGEEDEIIINKKVRNALNKIL